ncbi:hypothetical protein LIER_09820 [Lithospermum erythrorhizon]|uniref:DUF7795 domain-containing protein n=1 Tax=Lithospermum erythrorhizon TaxID=34254 RepID=A0AAV3PH57_LITER
MGSDHEKQEFDPNEKSRQLYYSFMASVAKFDELATLGSRLIAGFQQGLDYIRRPSFKKTSKLVDQIVKENETMRLSAYIEAGGRNGNDGAESVSKSKDIVDELEGFVHKITSEVQVATDNLYRLQLKDIELNDMTSQEESLSGNQKRDAMDYAALIAIIYSMVKQDYTMQVTSSDRLGCCEISMSNTPTQSFVNFVV